MSVALNVNIHIYFFPTIADENPLENLDHASLSVYIPSMAP